MKKALKKALTIPGSPQMSAHLQALARVDELERDLARLKLKLQLAEKVLKNYSRIDDTGRLDRDWVARPAQDYFKAKEKVFGLES